VPAPRARLALTGDADADALLDRDPFALLVGMLLDQQFPMEHAFAGPQKIVERLAAEGPPSRAAGRLDPETIVSLDPEAFAALCARPPAVHRYPGSMAGRIQALARAVVDGYGGDASALWTEAASGADLLARLRALPGFGDTKARIFVALLGKQRGVRPAGWETAAGAYAEAGSHRSVADVVDAASLAKVRAFKQEQKRSAKTR
jgi:uncharacterized HhH-GPD family protein